jgi:hypothetical protein
MTRIKTLALALMALSVFAISTAASASATELPDISVTLEESFPVKAEATSLKKAGLAFLETEVGSKLTAEQVKGELELTSLSALGAVKLTFVNTKEPKSGELCNTEGDAAGIVLVAGEFHVVFLAVGPPWTLHIDVLFEKPLVIKCGKLTIKVLPPALVALHANLEKDITEFTVDAKCAKNAKNEIEKGRQQFTEYINDAGTKLTKQLLLANFGLGFENACEQVEEELKFKTTKMILITP